MEVKEKSLTQAEVDQEFLTNELRKLDAQLQGIRDVKDQNKAETYSQAIRHFLTRPQISQAIKRIQNAQAQYLQENAEYKKLLEWLQYQMLLTQANRDVVIAEFNKLQKECEEAINRINDPVEKVNAAKLAEIFNDGAWIVISSVFIHESYKSPASLEEIFKQMAKLHDESIAVFTPLALTGIYSSWREFSAGIAEISAGNKFSGWMRISKALDSLATSALAAYNVIFNVIKTDSMEPITPISVLGLTITLGFRTFCSLVALAKNCADYRNKKITGKQLGEAINDSITNIGKFFGFFAQILGIAAGPGFIALLGASVVDILVKVIVSRLPEAAKKNLPSDLLRNKEVGTGDAETSNLVVHSPHSDSTSPNLDSMLTVHSASSQTPQRRKNS